MEVFPRRVSGHKGVPAYLALPDRKGPIPVVVLLHERYGLVRHTEDLAVRLASAGYAVLAPDLFYDHPDLEALHAGRVTFHPSDREVVEKIEDALTALEGLPGVDVARLGMIGVCQTGRHPFAWGAVHPLSACAVFYGAAQRSDWEVTEAQPRGMEGLIAAVPCPVLGIFGEKDHVISIQDVLRFRDTLERYRKSYTIRLYADAPHGWLNDTMPGRYRPHLAALAWQALLDFLQDTLQGAPADTIQWQFVSEHHPDYDFGKNVRLE